MRFLCAFLAVLSLAWPADPTTAIDANNLAGEYLDSGDLDSAERWAREALRLAALTLPADHPDHQLIWTTIASIYAYRGDLSRAEPLYRSILFHLEKLHGPNHIEVGLAAGNLAELYQGQERHKEAVGLYRKAIAVLEAISKSDRWRLLWARSGLMVSCSRIGQGTEAESLSARLLPTAERLLPANDPRMATILHRVALVKLTQLDHASARRLIEQELPILEAAYGASSPRMIAPLETYAQVLRAGKDRRAAKRTNARLKLLLRDSQTEKSKETQCND